MVPLAAEQDIRPGAIVKCKRDELAGREPRTRVRDRTDGGQRSFFRHYATCNSVAGKSKGVLRAGSGSEIVGTTTSAEYSETGN